MNIHRQYLSSFCTAHAAFAAMQVRFKRRLLLAGKAVAVMGGWILGYVVAGLFNETAHAAF